jgi:hypothetical protein
MQRMDRCPTLWNLLHDGIVVAIAGSVPGEVRLEIEADYLRNRFAESGNRFVLTLRGCRRFVFCPWDSKQQATSDVVEIERKTLLILSADQVDEYCVVHCSEPARTGEGGGRLEVTTDEAVFALDSGRAVAVEELATVSDAYWDEWESRNPSKIDPHSE